MKTKILISILPILLSFTFWNPLELSSREIQPLNRQGSPVGFYQGTLSNLEEAQRSFENNNIVEATLRLVRARENLNRLQRQLQEAQDKVNDALQFLNQTKPEQARASITLALDALDPNKQILESSPAITQRDRRENLRMVKEDLLQARDRFRNGDIAGAIQSIRTAQDTLDILRQQYPEYGNEIQQAQSRLNEAVYFLNQNKPREAANAVKGVVDILEPLREGAQR